MQTTEATVEKVKRLQHLEVNIIYGLAIQLKYVFK